MDLKCYLFDILIQPILEYGCELWGSSVWDEIEKVLRRFCKYLLRLPAKATSAAVLGELGHFPMHLRCQLRAVRYWLRLESGCVSPILFEAYQLSKLLANSGCNSWYNKVVTLIAKNGFRFIAVSPTMINKGHFLDQFWSTLTNSYCQYWSGTLWDDTRRRSGGHNKLRTYRLFKKDFGWESYLHFVSNPSHRVALTKFRTSAHCLQIERGRYHKPQAIPPDMRFCPYCKNLVENEIHFLVICPLYKNIRNTLFKIALDHHDVFNYLSAEDKFLFLMTSNIKSIICEPAKFHFVGENYVDVYAL